MSPKQILECYISPKTRCALDVVLGFSAVNNASALMLLAIGYQESSFSSRKQHGNGPARSYWQFEKAGIEGVLTHRASSDKAAVLCSNIGYEAEVESVYRGMEGNDLLGAGFARLLLWTDPEPLPQPDGESGEDKGWAIYKRLWRPGKPHRDRWEASWILATNTLQDHRWSLEKGSRSAP